jgi:DNA-binding transcriptional MerR regulator
MNTKNENTYSTGTVARMTGIPKYKLRDWCDRHLTHVKRIPVGRCFHRRFTEEDVQIVDSIKRMIADGMTLRAAVAKALAEIKKESGMRK